MRILLCEQNFRDVWIRNKNVRAEIGQILRTHTHTHTHAAKLVVEIGVGWVRFLLGESRSRLYPHMRAKFGRDPTAGSKKVYFKFIIGLR